MAHSNGDRPNVRGLEIGRSASISGDSTLVRGQGVRRGFGNGRSRNFIWRYSNYVPDYKERLDLIVCRFIAWGEEICPSTGTPHLQGFICFDHAKKEKAVKLLFGDWNVHIEIMKGRIDQNEKYCSKEGSYQTRGVKPVSAARKGEMEKERWDAALVSMKAGRLDELPSDILIRFYGTAKTIARDYMSPLPSLDSTCGIYIYGVAGVGKSHYARELSGGDPYPKMMNKWWCGYQGHEWVVLDDIDPDHAKFMTYFLKIWTDKYSFVAESKNGTMMIRPKNFIVTSQYSLDEVFEGRGNEALRRRFKVIHITRVGEGERFINVVDRQAIAMQN
nr:MAG: replication associated protein [Arizlama virus]